MKNRHNRMTLKCSAFLLAACIVMGVAGCSKKDKEETPELSSIKIANYVGDVSLSENGAASDMKTQVQLSKDNVLTTGENGSVDVQLDATKMVGLDVNSSAKFIQDGNNNTVELNQGALYFYTTEKVAEGEKFTINTPSMSFEIRGTSGYIIYNEKTGVAKITLTSGEVHIIGSNPEKGGTNEIDIEAGQSAQLCLFDYIEGPDSVRFLMEKITVKDLPPLLVKKIVENPEVFARVAEETNWDKDEMQQIAASVDVVNASVEGSENYAAASAAAQNATMSSLSTVYTTQAQADEAGIVLVGDDQVTIGSADGAQPSNGGEDPVVKSADQQTDDKPVGVQPVVDQPVDDQPQVDVQQNNQDRAEDSKTNTDGKDTSKDKDRAKDKDISKDKDTSKDKDSKDKGTSKDSTSKTDTKTNADDKTAPDKSGTTGGGSSGGGSSVSSGGGGGAGAGTLTSNRISVPSNLTGGTVTSSHARAEAGTSVTITFKPNAGYKLDNYTINGEVELSGSLSEVTYTFKMPNDFVIIGASFSLMSYEFSLPESVNGCDVWIIESGSTAETLKSKYFHYGDTVSFGVRVNGSYSLDEVKVSSGDQLIVSEKEGYMVYSFTMPAENVTASLSTQAQTNTYKLSIAYDDNCNFQRDEESDEVIVPAFVSGSKIQYAPGDEVEIVIEYPPYEILDNFPIYLYKGSVDDEHFWMATAYELDHETETVHIYLTMPESDVIIYFAPDPDAVEPIG